MKHLPKDKLKWAAAAFALVATATAEYELARAIGMNQWVAAAVPGALDAYVVRALRAHREVLTAVLAMVAVNAASHLVSAGVLKVEWPLITAVSAIAPLVLWRVHALGTPGQWRARKIWGDEHTEHIDVHASTDPEHGRAPDNPEPPGTREHPEGCVHGHAECDGERACTVYRSVHSLRDLDSDGAQRVLDAVHGEHVTCPLCSFVCSSDVIGVHIRETCPQRFEHKSTAPVHTGTDDWMDVHDAVHASTPLVHAPYEDHVVIEHTSTRHLTAVPDVEHTEHTRTAEDWDLEHVATGVLEPEDVEHMERARELFHTAGGQVPTFRVLKDGTPGMGTPRAKRIRAALKAEAGGEN